MEPTPSQAIDDLLMERVAVDDQDALADVISRWQNRIYVFLLRMVSQPDLAEVLTQETFWRLWQARARYQPQGRFGAYLFQIAARLAMQHWRNSKNSIPSSPLAENIPAPRHDGPDYQVREAEMVQALESALRRLPEKQRTALELSRLEGMTQAEVAVILGCSTGAVEQLIYRARQALRILLAPYLETQPKKID